MFSLDNFSKPKKRQQFTLGAPPEIWCLCSRTCSAE